jgi:hypothetical protein
VADSPGLAQADSPGASTSEFVTTLKEVAQGETTAPPAGTVVPDTSCHHSDALADSLRTAATHLYERAQKLEIDGDYGRADGLRGLARSLREQIDWLSRENPPPPPTAPASAPTAPSAVTASAPPTVTEAPFNPEPPAAPPAP